MVRGSGNGSSVGAGPVLMEMDLPTYVTCCCLCARALLELLLGYDWTWAERT